MTSNSIRLPYVVVTAVAATELYNQADLDSTLSEEVTIYARVVSTSSTSFANNLVALLSEAGFTVIRLRGASMQLEEHIRQAVNLHPNLSVVTGNPA